MASNPSAVEPPKRDMRLPAIKSRVRSYMAYASEVLKNLPDTYKPEADGGDSSSDEEDASSARKKRKLAFEKRREALVRRGTSCWLVACNLQPGCRK